MERLVLIRRYFGGVIFSGILGYTDCRRNGEWRMELSAARALGFEEMRAVGESHSLLRPRDNLIRKYYWLYWVNVQCI